MGKYQRILIPIDSSEDSKRAIEHAITVEAALGATITLLYVSNFGEIFFALDPMTNTNTYITDSVVQGLEHKGLHVLHNLAAIIPKEFCVKVVYTSGLPVDRIIEAAKQYDSDLIIMGIRRTGKFMRLLLGKGISSYVIPRSECPVLVVQ